MPSKVSSYSNLFAVAILILALDQASKILVQYWFTQGGLLPIALTPFLNIIYIINNGISFGILNNLAYSQLLFSAVSLLICFTLGYWITREENFTNKLLLTIVIAGALGNVIDRIRIGGVIDFIDFHYRGWHYPAFNIADSAIVIALVMYILLPGNRASAKPDKL